MKKIVHRNVYTNLINQVNIFLTHTFILHTLTQKDFRKLEYSKNVKWMQTWNGIRKKKHKKLYKLMTICYFISLFLFLAGFKWILCKFVMCSCANLLQISNATVTLKKMLYFKFILMFVNRIIFNSICISQVRNLDIVFLAKLLRISRHIFDHIIQT